MTRIGETEPSLGRGPDSPLADYALVGDGRAGALVGRDGSIDWLALPEDESIAVFDRVLDAGRGGRFGLRVSSAGGPGPGAAARISRRYLPGTMVLESTHTVDSGTLVVTDVVTMHGGALLPWTEVARRLECVAGRVRVLWAVEPSMRLGGRCRPIEVRRGRHQAVDGTLSLGVMAWDAGEVVPTTGGAGGATELASGDTALVGVVLVDGQPLPRPDRQEVERRIDGTVESWRGWTEGIEHSGRWQDQVRRSASVLRLLVHRPTGAILAAPTTSLPERIGGDRNYDYRYCWTRDASFTIDALLRVGLVEEAHAAIVALGRMARTSAPMLAPFYRVDGSVPDRSDDVDLPGYRSSRPVRCGNAASHQLQLGCWGDLLESIWIYVRQGNDLDAETAAVFRSLVDTLCEVWERPDSGMWELPARRHYTISKMGAWVAFDRALRLHDAGQLEGDASRWAAHRDAVRHFVETRCWSDELGTYTFHPETDELDAACLLAARTGFADGRGVRMAGTIEAVRRELCDGPFVYRYSGQQDREGAFLACSYWLADALARAGRLAEAADQIDGALAGASDLGLMAEEYDPGTGELRGNHPQGLSHLAFVNAASVWMELSGSR